MNLLYNLQCQSQSLFKILTETRKECQMPDKNVQAIIQFFVCITTEDIRMYVSQWKLQNDSFTPTSSQIYEIKKTPEFLLKLIFKLYVAADRHLVCCCCKNVHLTFMLKLLVKDDNLSFHCNLIVILICRGLQLERKKGK